MFNSKQPTLFNIVESYVKTLPIVYSTEWVAVAPTIMLAAIIYSLDDKEKQLWMTRRKILHVNDYFIKCIESNKLPIEISADFTCTGDVYFVRLQDDNFYYVIPYEDQGLMHHVKSLSELHSLVGQENVHVLKGLTFKV